MLCHRKLSHFSKFNKIKDGTPQIWMVKHEIFAFTLAHITKICNCSRGSCMESNLLQQNHDGIIDLIYFLTHGSCFQFADNLCWFEILMCTKGLVVFGLSTNTKSNILHIYTRLCLRKKQAWPHNLIFNFGSREI